MEAGPPSDRDYHDFSDPCGPPVEHAIDFSLRRPAQADWFANAEQTGCCGFRRKNHSLRQPQGRVVLRNTPPLRSSVMSACEISAHGVCRTAENRQNSSGTSAKDWGPIDCPTINRGSEDAGSDNYLSPKRH